MRYNGRECNILAISNTRKGDVVGMVTDDPDHKIVSMEVHDGSMQIYHTAPIGTLVDIRVRRKAPYMNTNLSIVIGAFGTAITLTDVIDEHIL